MIDDLPPLPPEVRVLLDSERLVPSLPPEVRARALAAARAVVAAGPAPVPLRPPSPWIRWAVVATVAAGAVAGVTGYRLHARHGAHEPAVVVAAPSVSPPAVSAPPPAPVTVAAPEPAPASSDESPKRAPAVAAREELRLLRQARAAVARQDFAGALPILAEHARYFRDGRLAEEREALRVKALAGLGRTDDARRTAAAFAARFPRSVLLPAVTRMTDGDR